MIKKIISWLLRWITRNEENIIGFKMHFSDIDSPIIYELRFPKYGFSCFIPLDTFMKNIEENLEQLHEAVEDKLDKLEEE